MEQLEKVAPAIKTLLTSCQDVSDEALNKIVRQWLEKNISIINTMDSCVADMEDYSKTLAGGLTFYLVKSKSRSGKTPFWNMLCFIETEHNNKTGMEIWYQLKPFSECTRNGVTYVSFSSRRESVTVIRYYPSFRAPEEFITADWKTESGLASYGIGSQYIQDVFNLMPKMIESPLYKNDSERLDRLNLYESIIRSSRYMIMNGVSQIANRTMLTDDRFSLESSVINTELNCSAMQYHTKTLNGDDAHANVNFSVRLTHRDDDEKTVIDKRYSILACYTYDTHPCLRLTGLKYSNSQFSCGVTVTL